MRSGRPAPLASLLNQAASFSLLASTGELIVLAVKRFMLGRPVNQSVDVIWANPLVNLFLFLAGALALWGLQRLTPWLTARFVAGLMLFVVLGAILLAAVPGSPGAVLLLAAGLATQGSRLFVSDAAGRRLRRSAAVLVAVIGVASGSTLYREARRMDAVTGTAPAGAPNVLLIILDTVRAASLGLYGAPLDNTPGLESLASRGVTFDVAIAPAPWTLPTHATMFTGLWPSEHGADWLAPLDGRATTLAEALGARGYRTGGFVANLTYGTREHGLSRGFQVYKDFDRSIPSLLRTSSIIEQMMTMTVLRRLTGYYDIAIRKRAPVVNKEFLAWQEHAGTRPWFAFLNYFDAHEPYRPTAPFAGRYSAGLPPRRHDMERFWHLQGGIIDWTALSAEDVAAERAAYEELIAELDHNLAGLFDELRRRGVLDRTLVIVTSDHGEQFGEHDWFTHGNSLYWRVLRVPLVISYPGHVSMGVRIQQPASLRDLAATVWEFVAPDEPSPFPGESLFGADRQPAWVPSEVTADPAMLRGDPNAMVDLASVSTASWHYIRAVTGAEELFPVVGGEAGDRSVAGDSAWRAALDSGRAALSAQRQRVRLPNVP